MIVWLYDDNLWYKLKQHEQVFELKMNLYKFYLLKVINYFIPQKEIMV